MDREADANAVSTSAPGGPARPDSEPDPPRERSLATQRVQRATPAPEAGRQPFPETRVCPSSPGQLH